MKYDIEADWILLQTCNYRCAYCFAPAELLGEKLRRFATPKQWRESFDATGRTWLLHITGGEPSIYQDFVDLTGMLTARHYISLNTNLTHSSLQDFARHVEPSRVNFINAGFHLEERERRAGHTVFLKNAETLLARKFPLLVSLVALPTVLERFDDAVAILRPLGLAPIPKLFRGLHEGKLYPSAYSAADRSRFSDHAERARDCYAPLIEQMSEPPTLDMLGDDRFLNGEPRYTGRSCEAGSRFVRIEPNGDVRRCGPPGLGNLLAGTFKPMRGPARCDTQFCYYFCEKYTRAVSAASASPIERFALRFGFGG